MRCKAGKRERDRDRDREREREAAAASAAFTVFCYRGSQARHIQSAPETGFLLGSASQL